MNAITTLKGIVIRERASSDTKFLDILTEKDGVIEITASGAKKITNAFGSASELWSYSVLDIKESRGRTYLNAAQILRIFYGLRDDIKKTSLAFYMSEVVADCIKPEPTHPDIIRLFLNTLHYIENGSRDIRVLKSIFELRLLCLIGFTPAAESAAAKYIMSADFDRLYNLTIPEEEMYRLGEYTERYLITCLERGFKTLDFYWKV